MNVGDLCAMCIARSLGELYAIRDATPTDELIHGGGKAWDVNAGRLNIDLQNGHTTDPSTSAVDQVGLQFMCRNPETNEVFVGWGSLCRRNTSNSTTTPWSTSTATRTCAAWSSRSRAARTSAPRARR